MPATAACNFPKVAAIFARSFRNIHSRQARRLFGGETADKLRDAGYIEPKAKPRVKEAVEKTIYVPPEAAVDLGLVKAKAPLTFGESLNGVQLGDSVAFAVAGRSAQTFIDQQSLDFGDEASSYTPIQQSLFLLLAESKSAKRVKETLSRYLGWAEASGAAADTLLGAPPTAAELVNRAIDEQSDAETTEWQVAGNVIGKTLKEALPYLSPDESEDYPALARLSAEGATLEMAMRLFKDLGECATDRDGNVTYLYNPDEVTRQKYLSMGKTISGKAGRVIHVSTWDDRVSLASAKVRWITRIKSTIEKYDLVLKDEIPSNYVYIKRYDEGLHTVIVTDRGVFIDQSNYDYGLLTQLTEKDKNKRLGYQIIRQTEPHQSQLSATQPLVATPDTPNDVAGLVRLTGSKIVRVADNVKHEIEKKTKKVDDTEYQERPMPKEVEDARAALENAQSTLDNAESELSAVGQEYELAVEMGKPVTEIKVRLDAARNALAEAEKARNAAHRDFLNKLDAAENEAGDVSDLEAVSPEVAAASADFDTARNALAEANKNLIAMMDEMESCSKAPGGVPKEVQQRFEAAGNAYRDAENFLRDCENNLRDAAENAAVDDFDDIDDSEAYLEPEVIDAPDTPEPEVTEPVSHVLDPAELAAELGYATANDMAADLLAAPSLTSRREAFWEEKRAEVEKELFADGAPETEVSDGKMEALEQLISALEIKLDRQQSKIHTIIAPRVAFGKTLFFSHRPHLQTAKNLL